MSFNLKAIHDESYRNKDLLDNSTSVGCFYCLTEMKPKQITEFITGEDTALCPICGIDSVIPLDKYTTHKERRSVLHQMHQEYFEQTLSFSEFENELKKNTPTTE